MDWSSLISEIQARGLSLTQIARICDCGQSTLSDLKGKPKRDPAFRLGQALIKLNKASDREIARLLAQADKQEAV